VETPDVNRTATILLALLAVGVAAFLVWLEPRMTSTREDVAAGSRVLTMDVGTVRGLRITSGGEELEIGRKGESWWMGPKPKDRVSAQAVREILDAAQNLGALDVIKAGELKGELDLKDFGLNNPRTRLDIRGDGKAALLFGKEAVGEGRMYVRMADSNDVFIVSDELQRLAFRNPEELRDRRLTDVTPDQIERFVIRRGRGEMELVNGPKGWELVKPLRAKADARKVAEFLSPLLGMQILEFVADDSGELGTYGLSEPQVELALSIDGIERPQLLRLGSTGRAGDTPAVYAQFTARDSVYWLPEQAVEFLQIGPNALRDRRLLNLNLDTVDKISVRQGDKAVTASREDNGWRVTDGELSVTIGDSRMKRLVRTLTEIPVREFRPLGGEGLATYGLDAPTAVVQFDAWLSENTPETTAGRHPIATVAFGAVDGETVFARVGEAAEVCILPAETAELLSADIAEWRAMKEAAGRPGESEEGDAEL
jgi:hypothetical protein